MTLGAGLQEGGEGEGVGAAVLQAEGAKVASERWGEPGLERAGDGAGKGADAVDTLRLTRRPSSRRGLAGGRNGR